MSIKFPDELFIDIPGLIADADFFGPVAACTNLNQVTDLLRRVVDDEAARSVAAFGMILAGKLAPDAPHRQDALQFLDFLNYARAILDQARAHSPAVTIATASVVAAAQKYSWEATVPCTEWPSVKDLEAVVMEKAKAFADRGPWLVTVEGENGITRETRWIAPGDRL